MSGKSVIIVTDPPPPPPPDGGRVVAKKVRYVSLNIEVDSDATPEQVALAYERGIHALARLNE